MASGHVLTGARVKSHLGQRSPVGGLSVVLEGHHTMADNAACTGVNVP